jgi:hypothetical protein
MYDARIWPERITAEYFRIDSDLWGDCGVEGESLVIVVDPGLGIGDGDVGDSADDDNNNNGGGGKAFGVKGPLVVLVVVVSGLSYLALPSISFSEPPGVLRSLRNAWIWCWSCWISFMALSRRFCQTMSWV